MHTYNNGLRE